MLRPLFSCRLAAFSYQLSAFSQNVLANVGCRPVNTQNDPTQPDHSANPEADG
jgi:hypothetical protein